VAVSTGKVQVKANGQAVNGVCILCSENKYSLAIMLDEPLHTTHGTYAGGLLPLLWNEERERYEELVGGEAVEVVWLP
jgi:hypothetical protein